MMREQYDDLPMHGCSFPRCPNRQPGKTCDEHRKAKSQQYDRERVIDNDFYSTDAWRQFRIVFIAEHPFCEWPMADGGNCRARARVVDHIESRRKNPDRDPFDKENLWRICIPHHNHKSLVYDGGCGNDLKPFSIEELKHALQSR